MSVPKLETIEITLFPNGVAEIAHNRPKRYNALSPQSYRVTSSSYSLDTWSNLYVYTRIGLLLSNGQPMMTMSKLLYSLDVANSIHQDKNYHSLIWAMAISKKKWLVEDKQQRNYVNWNLKLSASLTQTDL